MPTTKEALDVFFTLMPGFLAAGVFHLLTAHPKPKELERVVQALIFTVIIKGAVITVKGVLLLLGMLGPPICRWPLEAEIPLSVVAAVALGLFLAWNANTDRLHQYLLVRWTRTKETSFPSNWCAAFSKHSGYVLLHLKSGRRLYGWPEYWPNVPGEGHFVIMEPEWVLEDNRSVPVHVTRQVLVATAEVEMIELLKSGYEITVDTNVRERDDLILIGLQKTANGDEHAREEATTPVDSASGVKTN
jgi:Family of unknown function (DUF6338)